MLPFQKKKLSPMLVAKVTPDGKMDPQGEEGGVDPGLISAAEELISAVKSGDAEAVAMALQAAFELCDSMPHEEGPHVEVIK